MALAGWGRPALRALLLGGLFYAGAKASVGLALMPESLVVLWIPNSIVLGVLLVDDVRRYVLLPPLIIAAEVAADYPTYPLAAAVLFAILNMIEVGVALVLLRRLRFDPALETPADLAKFVFAGPVVAAFVSACGGAAVYRLFGLTHDAVEVLQTWWFGDALGLVLLTPVVLTLVAPHFPQERFFGTLRWYDGVALAVTFAAAIALIVDRELHAVRPFVLLPGIVYAAARFSMRVASLFTTFVAAMLVLLASRGWVLFGPMAPKMTVGFLQEFIAMMSVISLGISALMSQVRRANRELETRVAARTNELHLANVRLAELASTDSLTGLLNRRALFASIQREIERERRHPHGLALIAIDIDHFKEVNDRHGHAAGDAVLRDVGEIMRAQTRASDAVGRVGGEEFVVVATDTDEENAMQLAERLRAGIEGAFTMSPPPRVTASLGVSLFHPEMKGVDDLLAHADGALYAAKRAGRNCVRTDRES